jgi:hypothetical protein
MAEALNGSRINLKNLEIYLGVLWFNDRYDGFRRALLHSGELLLPTLSA